ncbi:MAG: Rieske 2Fe-2S domain-containing protein [Chloroflexi bacterium]|nr:Rieske 2Fe-2S domain-containing protein [Chloroflexota bacterium]
METPEMDRYMTLVGPGEPAGELLRRYWMPVAVAAELTDEHPTRFVRLLGEDLVLFRDKSGRVGLLADHCSHRGVSLLYGRVEERGISCAYHGWLYDCEGNILETPPERNDAIMRSVKQVAYPVQKLIGLYWAYLGPLPAPVIPHYDAWARRDGHRKIFVQPVLDCNWLAAMENSVDPAHTSILHQRQGTENTTRGNIDRIAQFDFYLHPYGLMKRRVWKNGVVDEHPVLFPNVLRHASETQIRVPIDDTHTQIYIVDFYPTPDGAEVDEEPEVEHVASFKQPADALHPLARFDMHPEWLKAHKAQPQDHMAWETQGPMASRTTEHLSYSDQGIVLYRKLLRENIEKVRAGQDPMGVQWDPDHGIIDTNLDESIRVYQRQGGEGAEVVATTGAGPFQWKEAVR